MGNFVKKKEKKRTKRTHNKTIFRNKRLTELHLT